MDETVESELVARWRDIMERNREVLQIWRASDFRLRVNGIDITQAEISAAEARIEHIQKLICSLEDAKTRPSELDGD